MVTEAQIYLEREQQGFKEESLQDKAHIDPETQKVYEQMYSLGPQAYPEGATDVNPAGIMSHHGKS